MYVSFWLIFIFSLQDLMATLSTRDQKEMDTLNDDIRELKQENKKAFAERMRLEAQVNKLENLLTNNLNRRSVLFLTTYT